MGRLANIGGGDVNTPEEHAAAVLRAPGPITVASIAGAIRAYADEVKGSQIADADKLAKLAAVTAERDAALAQQKLGWERAAEHYRAYEQAMAERDAALAELNRVTEHYQATQRSKSWPRNTVSNR